MAIGGKRVGAGRKKGVLDKKTQALQQLVAAGGLIPLPALIEAMGWLRAKALDALSQKDIDPKELREWILAYAYVAKDAAPYVHQRLAALEVIHRPPDLSRLSDVQLAELDRLLAAANPVPRISSGGDSETHH